MTYEEKVQAVQLGGCLDICDTSPLDVMRLFRDRVATSYRIGKDLYDVWLRPTNNTIDFNYDLKNFNKPIQDSSMKTVIGDIMFVAIHSTVMNNLVSPCKVIIDNKGYEVIAELVETK